MGGWALVAIQLALLAALVVLPGGSAWPVPEWARLLLRVVQGIGLGLAAWGLLDLGRSLTAHPAPVPHGVLRTGGSFRFARHPIYGGLMVWAAATAVRSGNPWSVLTFVALVLLFNGKARWEEAMLAARYPGYRAYAAVTPRFIPGPWRRAGS